MKRIHIFKAGTHTSSDGKALEFTESHLQGMVNAYDPKLHEAPIVVGHPKDNGPAFGWVGGMSIDGDNVYANPEQLNPDFAEQVKAGAFKKVSASMYTPDHPSNPAPGNYYLRHVGFLGAQPPAIKGLDPIEFSEEAEGEVVEFAAEWETAGIFRRMREFFIEKFGVEEADKAIPGFMVESAEDAARTPPKDSEPDFNEPPTGDTLMTEEELRAAQAQLKADKDAHDANVASFQEQQTKAAEAAQAARKKAISDRVDALVTAGKVLPAKAEGIKVFTEKLDAEAVVEFGEGDGKVSQAAEDFLFSILEGQAAGPDFSEHAGSDGDGDGGDGMTAEQLAKKAIEFMDSEKTAGRKVSYTQAVAQATAANQ